MWETFQSLGIALAIGLLIGIERGWKQREMAEGDRVAGLRTFGLIGLMGGIMALLEPTHLGWLVPAGFVVLGAFVLFGHWRAARETGDYGITTEVAALVTYLLGALAVAGQPTLAAAGAVMVAALLGMKPYLHHALQRLQQFELVAGLHLALISLVVLPVLPDRGYGPWGVLNPYELWLMVVLISAISFAGHFAVRIAGARRGLMLTGLFAGLAASTALTLSFSRIGRERPALQPVLAAAVVVAGITMFPRILLEVAVINPGLTGAAAVPLATLTAAGALGAAWLWRRESARELEGEGVSFRRPFELGTAIKFAAALAVILMAAEWARRYLGDAGIYVVSVLSGLTDVDAITLSLSRMANTHLDGAAAIRGILLAATANTVVKGGMVAVICGGRMARGVAGVFAVVVLIAVAFVLLPPALGGS